MVLLTFRESLLFINQLLTRISSEFINLHRVSYDLCDKKKCVSSAKSKKWRSEEAQGRSLMKSRNKRGPRMEPCGTPNLILLRAERTPLHFTCCDLSDKLLLNHESATHLLPILSNLRSSNSWFTVSKALATSTKTPREYSPRSKAAEMLSCKLRRDSAVEWPDRNPC